MKTTFRLLAVALVAVAFAGCATSKSNEPPPPYMTQAVLKSFTDIFDGSWSGVKIYIEPNAAIPSDIKKAGQGDAEIVDKQTLMKRFQYEENAPAMAVVNAYNDSTGLVHVEISYFPLRIKGTRVTTKQSSYHHVFRRTGKELSLVSSSKSTD